MTQHTTDPSDQGRPQESIDSHDPFAEVFRLPETRETSSGRFLTKPAWERALDEAFDEAIETVKRGGDRENGYLDGFIARTEKPPTLSDRIKEVGGEHLLTVFNDVGKKFLVSEGGKEEALRYLSERKEQADSYAFSKGGGAVKLAAARAEKDRVALIRFRSNLLLALREITSETKPKGKPKTKSNSKRQLAKKPEKKEARISPALRQSILHILRQPIWEIGLLLRKHFENLPVERKQKTASIRKGIDTDKAPRELANILWGNAYHSESDSQSRKDQEEIRKQAKQMLIAVGIRRRRRPNKNRVEAANSHVKAE